MSSRATNPAKANTTTITFSILDIDRYIIRVTHSLHFLGKDVTGITFTSDVSVPEIIILNPFLDGVFPKFHITDVLRSGVVGPVGTSFIVIVNSCRSRVVKDWIAGNNGTVGKISCSHGSLTAFVGGSDFGFTRI